MNGQYKNSLVSRPEKRDAPRIRMITNLSKVMIIHHLRWFLLASLAAGTATFAAPVPERLTEASVLRLAMENNYNLRKAEARLSRAEGGTLSARSRRLPGVELSAQYRRIDENRLESFSGETFGDTRSWNADLTATQPLYTGGAIKAGVEGSTAEESAAAADLSTARLDTLLAVKEAWFTALLRREQVDVQQRSVKLRGEQLQNTRNRFEAGTVSRFEVLQAEVALANVRPDLIRAKNDFRLAVIDLLNAIGLSDPGRQLPRIEGRLRFSPIGTSLREALSTARSQRPEYRALEKRREAAEAGVTEAKSGRRPVLNFTAGYGIQKTSFSDQLDDTVQGWSIGLQGSWNLWDWNETRGEILSARASVREARLSLEELDLGIAAEVRRALSSVEEAAELVDASRKVVEQAEEALGLAEDRFAVGNAIQLDVLEAQVALTRARTNEIRALFDHAVAATRLRKAMGILRFDSPAGP